MIFEAQKSNVREGYTPGAAIELHHQTEHMQKLKSRLVVAFERG